MLAPGAVKFWYLLFEGVSMAVVCTLGVLQLVSNNLYWKREREEMEDRHRREKLAWNVYRGMAQGKIVQFRRRQ